MSALYDLVSTELGKVGIRAQDDVRDHDRWVAIEDELGIGWMHLRADQFEQAAEQARKAKRMTDKAIKEADEDIIWERPAHMD